MQNLQEQGGYFDDVEGAAQIKNLRDVYTNLVGRDNIKTIEEALNIQYGSSLVDFNGGDYKDRTLTNLEADVSALDKKLIYSSNRAALWFVKAEIYDALAQKFYGKKENVVAAPATAGGTTTSVEITKLTWSDLVNKKVAKIVGIDQFVLTDSGWKKITNFNFDAQTLTLEGKEKTFIVDEAGNLQLTDVA